MELVSLPKCLNQAQRFLKLDKIKISISMPEKILFSFLVSIMEKITGVREKIRT